MAKIGWVRASPRFPAASQREALKAWGAAKVYELGKDGVSDIADFIKGLRPRDEVGVVGIHRFAEYMAGLAPTMRKIWARKVSVYDAEIQTELPPAAIAGVAAYANAKRVYDGEARMGDQAPVRGAMGGKVTARKRRVPLGKEHQRVWRDVVTYRTNQEAAAKVSEMLGRPVSVPTLRRKFKNSGRLPGWPGARE